MNIIVKDGIWAILTVVVVFWEVSGFLVRRGWAHPTISHLIKLFEGIDPITGKPVITPAGIVRRGLVAAGLIVLFLHWVIQINF